MKYKAVIADDNPFIRQALRETVKWEKLNCEICGAAEDGIEAKKLIKDICPDILITDIKMPGMDGLALTEYAKKYVPDIQVIMITGYQEFEYARKALTLGVFDLVLKPVKNELIEEKIKEALDSLEKKRNFWKEMNISLRARQEQFIHSLLKERAASEKVVKSRGKELGLDEKDYFLVLCRVRTGESSIEKKVQKKVMQCLERQGERKGWLVFEWISGKNQVLVVFEKEKRSARERKISLKQSLYTLNEKIREEEEVSCCFAVSRNSSELWCIPECYHDTLSVMEECYFTVERSVLFADSYISESGAEVGSLLRELNRFYQNVPQMEKRELKEQAEIMLERILQESFGDEFRIKCLLSEIGITFLRQWGEEDTTLLMEKVNALEGRGECEKFLYELFVEARDRRKREKEGSNPLVSASLAYIQKHYRENLSLTELAEKLSVNASYLSRLLKKETGKNFSEILTECRINRAKYLLEQPGSRVIEVCSEVGYSDYTYFYQVFKKLEHISPSDYRKKVKKSNDL